LFLDLFKKVVEKEEAKRRRQEANIYRQLASLGLATLGGITRVATKDDIAASA